MSLTRPEDKATVEAACAAFLKVCKEQGVKDEQILQVCVAVGAQVIVVEEDKRMDRTSPPDWDWAYHTTLEEFVEPISKNGLRPTMHPHVSKIPVIFVEPDLDGIAPYYREGMAVLRFKTPG